MIVGKTASEIFDSIRHLVQSGALKPGDVLPPVRELAGKLSVNRNTVAAAYKRLVTSGTAISQGVMVPPLKRIIPCPPLKVAILFAAEGYLQRQSRPRSPGKPQALSQRNCASASSVRRCGG